jgi:aspartyl-tRNA(Asn)/glutamyl-tRNA(Gln) amidotransferase subunit C
MEVNEALVDKLAGLARLSFNAEEKKAIAGDLEKMINFVRKMEEVDTSSVEPLLHMSGQKNIFREDEVTGQVSKNAALKNAGHHNDDFFLVPKVIKQ